MEGGEAVPTARTPGPPAPMHQRARVSVADSLLQTQLCVCILIITCVLSGRIRYFKKRYEERKVLAC